MSFSVTNSSPILITTGFPAATRIEFSNSQSQNFDIDDLTVSSVPEPVSGLLTLLGFTVLWRKHRNS